MSNENKAAGTVIELTREFVADAIEKEAKLQAGSFIYDDADEPAAGCGVCAVGAVMRRALAPTATRRTVFVTCDAATHYIESTPCSGDSRFEYSSDKEFVNAVLAHAADAVAYGPMTTLSYLFESLSNVDVCDPAEVRGRVVSFVREHFPERVTVSINGFEPAADVRVVSR